MTITFPHPPETATRRRPTHAELVSVSVRRSRHEPYTGSLANHPPTRRAALLSRLTKRRPKSAAAAAVECRSPADCDSAAEAMPLAQRRVFFLEPGRPLEYGTIISAHDGAAGIPEFIVSTDNGTVIKFGDEFKLSQLPDELAEAS